MGEQGSNPAVAVLIVTYNSADDLQDCLASVAALDYQPLEVVIVDCASHDASVHIAQTADLGAIPKTLVPLGENLGFSGGMNTALAHTTAPWVLLLNPDARPEPQYLQRLLRNAGTLDSVGGVTGRLVRPKAYGVRHLDACGMVLTTTWRHLDRGSGEIDRGQLGQLEEVFGATGAASLFSRAALDDVALDGEVFDRDFHSYREDAELAFRLGERGWRILYEPSAVCEHRRRVVPDNRASLPSFINYHSLKNRYLLRAYHQSAANFCRTFLPTLWRDVLALGYVLLRERTSLPAYAWLWRHRRRIWQRRRRIQGRRTASIDHWFHRASKPLE